MRLLAEELRFEVLTSLERRVKLVEGAGVHHHRRGSVFEGAGVNQLDLAPASLLGRGTEHRYPNSQLLGQGGHRHPCSGRRRGDDVVAAGVADLGQGVVLAADDHSWPSGSDRRLECRV